MAGNLNTSDETNYLPVAMFQSNLSFQASSLFQNKNIFFKMGSLTELLPMTNLPVPPPNPAHNSRGGRRSPTAGLLLKIQLLVRYFSSYCNPFFVLSHSIGVWYTLGSRVWLSNMELKWCITRFLPPFLFCLS